jgi:hypothetical protein
MMNDEFERHLLKIHHSLFTIHHCLPGAPLAITPAANGLSHTSVQEGRRIDSIGDAATRFVAATAEHPVCPSANVTH